jgi:hypothetical protein
VKQVSLALLFLIFLTAYAQNPVAGGSGGSGSACATCSLVMTNTAVSSIATSTRNLWLMNEGSGGSFSDSSGVANTLTAGGTVTWDTGPTGGKSCNPCAHFPGTFETGSANHTNFNPDYKTDAFSVVAWVGFDSGHINDYATVFIQSNPAGTNPGFHLFKNNTGGGNNNMLIYNSQDDSGHLVLEAFAPALLANHMYMTVCTSSGASAGAAAVKCYLDGQLMVVSQIINDNLSSASKANVNMGIASANSSATQFRLYGWENNVRTFNYVLTPAQIQALYMAGPNGTVAPRITRNGTMVYASSLVTLDCNVETGTKIGGGTCTDNVNALNAVLATATQELPLELILDGGTAVGSPGLLIAQAGYTTIRCNGANAGVFVLPASNANAISNGNGMSPNYSVLPSQGGYVHIKGCKINGNRGTYPDGNSNLVDASGAYWLIGLSLFNVNDVRIEDNYFYDTPAYAGLLGNVNNVNYRGNVVVEPSHNFQNDGIHIDGPATNIFISDSYFEGGDDAIALNAPEGQQGAITNVQINNIQAKGFSIARIYTNLGSGSTFNVSGVTINNAVGQCLYNTSYCAALILHGGTDTTGGTDSIQSLKLNNITWSGPTFARLGAPIGELDCTNCTWLAPSAANPMFLFDHTATTVSSLSLTNSRIYRNTDGNSAAYLTQVISGDSIKKLTLNGFSIENEQGQSYSAVANLIDIPSGGAIGTLHIPTLDPTLITSVLSSGSSARLTNLISPLAIKGATPTVTNASCTGAAIGTGATNAAGTITGLPTSACSVVLNFAAATAPTGWHCTVSDQTTAVLFRQSANTTTSATFAGTSVSGDVLSYACTAR